MVLLVVSIIVYPILSKERVKMSDIGEGMVTTIIVAVLLFVAAIIGTLVGALIGWVIQLTPLGNLVINGLLPFGVDVSGKLVELGATCGFIGNFFRSSGGKSSD